MVGIGDPLAPGPRGEATGAAHLLRVGSDGAEPVRVIYGQGAGDRLGATVSAAGGELWVGAPGAGGGAGQLVAVTASGTPRAWVSGTAGLALGSGPVRAVPAGAASAGQSAAALVGGSPDAFGGDGALVRIALGGALLGAVRGAQGERLGAALSEPTASGTVLVGAPEALGGAGAVFECAPATLALGSLVAGEAGDRAGAVVVTVGDVDADGRSEVAVGRPGRATLASGRVGVTTVLREAR